MGMSTKRLSCLESQGPEKFKIVKSKETTFFWHFQSDIRKVSSNGDRLRSHILTLSLPESVMETLQ